MEYQNVVQDTSVAPTPSPVDPTPQKPNFIIPILSILIFVLIFGMAFQVYQNMSFRKEVASLKGTSFPTSTQVSSQSASLTPVYVGSYDVDVKISTDSPCNSDIYLTHCKSDIYLKDKTTRRETLVLTTNDVVRVGMDTRVPQYRNGYIFLVKRIGNDSGASKDWTDELWVYVDNNKGIEIYNSKGLSFNVNQNGSLVAIFSGNAKDSVILVSRDNAWQQKTYSIDVRQCNFSANQSNAALWFLGFEKWQQSPPALWGAYSGDYNVISCYWKLNPETSAIVYYHVPDYGQMLFALNTDKLFALYTDYPRFVDADSKDKWTSTHPTYSLYLYSLQTQKSIIIASFPSSFENIYADWDSSTQLHYLSPKGKVTYTLQGQ